MVDMDTFKVIVHDDDAFKTFLEKRGSEITMEQLQKMSMKLSTQLATFGDERPQWFKRAKSLLAVVKNRMDEVKTYEASELADYKDVLGDLLYAVRDKFDKYDHDLPDINDLDAVEQFIEEMGL